MLDSDFWAGLAEEFRKLDPHSCLCLNWKARVDGTPCDFELVQQGGSCRSVEGQFKVFATRAVLKLQPDEPRPTLTVWYASLKETGVNDAPLLWSQAPDNGPVLQWVAGRIYRICDLSADLCTDFARRALEAEHKSEVEEKQRLDPRNWSPLRQYYESFKVSKELLAQAPEEIPESLVRDVLAQQYGLRPQEVTEKQIIWEVSGLLREYPSITVIPAIPRLGVDAENVTDSRELLKAERERLRDSYLNGFVEKVYILDVCWAVKQRYREWTRWIGGYLKDKSKPARAFRAILESGKRPEEYRPEPRPKGWK